MYYIALWHKGKYIALNCMRFFFAFLLKTINEVQTKYLFHQMKAILIHETTPFIRRFLTRLK